MFILYSFLAVYFFITLIQATYQAIVFILSIVTDSL